MKKLFALAGVLAFSIAARGDLAFTAFNTPIIIDFTGFTAGGFNPTPGAGQLDSDDFIASGFSDSWVGGVPPAFSGTSSNAGDYARGSGSDAATTAGIYNYTGTLNSAIGFLPSGTEFNPGFFRMRILNSIGSAIDQISVSFDVHFRSTGAGTRTQTVDFAWSGNAFATTNGVSALSSLALPTATWSTNSLANSFAVAVNNGSYLELQWFSQDAGGTGSRSKFAIDNITITAIPEPGSLALLGLGGLGMLAWRRHRRRS